ncbi:hypothetical protein FQZ97_621820 [compost metagenome]
MLCMHEAGCIDDDVAAVVPRGQVGHEGRVAHQICQVLQQVALGVDAELAGRRLVAPLDAALLVEQHHAVGRSLDGGQELLQPVFGLPGLLFALAQQLADARHQLAPHARPARRQPGRVVAQHAQQAFGAPGIEAQPEHRAQPGAQPAVLPAKKADSARRNYEGRY